MPQDSSRPDFWDTRYRDAVTPWDLGRVPMRLAAFLRGDSAIAPPAVRARVLVPGCGSAYEARALADAGHDVLAIDFSAAAIAAARSALGPHAGIVRLADFFGFEGDHAPFDLIYERAFLCALPPRMAPGYAARVAQLLRPGGLLAGFWFTTPTVKGPPFGIEQAALDTLLAAAFERLDDQDSPDALPVFQGHERWQVWRRR